MKNYLNFKQDIKILEVELEKQKDPNNQEVLSEVDIRPEEHTLELQSH